MFRLDASTFSARRADLFRCERTGMADFLVARSEFDGAGLELAALSPMPDPPLRDVVIPLSPKGVVRPGEPGSPARARAGDGGIASGPGHGPRTPTGPASDLDLAVTAALQRLDLTVSRDAKGPRSKRLQRARAGVGPGGG